MVQKYDISDIEGGGGRYRKVSIKGESVKCLGPTTDREGMDTLSMVVLMVHKTCLGVSSPLGS